MPADASGPHHGHPGEPEDFSLAAGDNLHFVTRSPTRVRPGAPDQNALSFTSERSTT